MAGFVSQKPESLALERSVTGLELTSVADPPIRIRVNPRFKYVGGQRFILRDIAEPPAPDSDRRKAYELLERAGYVVPTPSTRVRLVHVPESNRRQEVMMIYLEPGAATELTAEQSSAIVRRATEGLTIRR